LKLAVPFSDADADPQLATSVSLQFHGQSLPERRGTQLHPSLRRQGRVLKPPNRFPEKLGMPRCGITAHPRVRYRGAAITRSAGDAEFLSGVKTARSPSADVEFDRASGVVIAAGCSATPLTLIL